MRALLLFVTLNLGSSLRVEATVLAAAERWLLWDGRGAMNALHEACSERPAVRVLRWIIIVLHLLCHGSWCYSSVSSSIFQFSVYLAKLHVFITNIIITSLAHSSRITPHFNQLFSGQSINRIKTNQSKASK